MKDEKFKIDYVPPLYLTYEVFIIIGGLILPVILIPVIKFVGYSEILEEVAKVFVVLFLILKLPSHRRQIVVAIIFGFLFGLSENFLYFNQIFQSGNLDLFFERFLFTIPMHIATVLIMIFSGMGRKIFLILGLIGAIILHALFNGIIVELLIR